MEKKNRRTTQEYPIHLLREQLRQQACAHALTLSRSVARLTSCDMQPCPEYQDEVLAEYEAVDQLLYTQQCRAALERCIAQGYAGLRYRLRDGRLAETCFRRCAPGRVKVWGLRCQLKRPALPSAS